MMFDRRKFLAASGLGLAALGGGWAPRGAEADPTWLAYAPDVELFWARDPLLERLRKVGEAGFTRYEFGRWQAKDVDAIARKNEELGLQAALFLGYPGLRGARWKAGLLDTVGDAAELAPRLGAPKIGVVGPDRDEKLERAEQVDDLVDALKEAVEKLAESEAVLILEPTRPATNRPAPLLGTIEEAAAVVKAVNSARVKFAFPIGPAEILDEKLPAQIGTFKGQAGHYRLVDFAPTGRSEGAYARALRAIHDAGFADPIGLGLPAKGDPSAAIGAIRKLDAAAKAS